MLIVGKWVLILGGIVYVFLKFVMIVLGIVVGNEEVECGIRIINVYFGEVNILILE